jgi:GNAT superfamily N-acetyltransferase
MPQLSWRYATLSDHALLTRLNKELAEDEGHFRAALPLAWFGERMAEFLAEGSPYSAVIFEHDGQPAAYALWRAEDPGFEGVYLRHFYVARDHRRSGLGRAAIAMWRGEALPPDTLVRIEALWGNQRGRAFWRAVGFCETYVGMETPAPARP